MNEGVSIASILFLSFQDRGTMINTSTSSMHKDDLLAGHLGIRLLIPQGSSRIQTYVRAAKSKMMLVQRPAVSFHEDPRTAEQDPCHLGPLGPLGFNAPNISDSPRSFTRKLA